FVLPPPPISSLFPYTTLFRSLDVQRHGYMVPIKVERYQMSTVGAAALSVDLPSAPSGPPRVPASLDTPRRASTIRQPRSRRASRSEEHTSELQSLRHLVCRLL